ncbi:T9SS type A sorting domain-containing protein [Aequorivita flava]|uniref:T9SS type A sorting domain-containing protein n=1 Tax=Aequorivita flava TaxID=3114371 RepID=A0AB35YQJ5_9FLAO
MFAKLPFVILLLICGSISAQIQFQDHVIIDDTFLPNGPFSVHSADIDGDGDMDLLSASRDDDKIAWYKNDGLGNFQTQQAISTNANLAISVYAADIDGDGDMDVLSASYEDKKIAWYENTNGQGAFGPEKIISTNANGARMVYTADIDGDGDVDVLSASSNDNKIAWYKNLDGLGNFSSEQIITSNANGALSVHTADIDGDGDQDVLSASYLDDKIAWYENTDGMGAFGGQQIISTDFLAPISIYAADFDLDGDMDIVCVSADDVDFIGVFNKTIWFENTDGQGVFASHEIDDSLDNIPLHQVSASDIDGDGDMDVLSTGIDQIRWYENIDGLGSFGPQRMINSNIQTAVWAHATDIDDDGDKDVVFASLYDDLVAWHENLDGLGSFGQFNNIVVQAVFPLSVYPADLDGDGDLDAISASSIDNKIAWYENLDGLGTFGIQNIIVVNLNGAGFVRAADVDGDGDMDVLSTSRDDYNIAWHENLDGQGSFGPPQIVSSGMAIGLSLGAIDIDRDGDLDIVSSTGGDSQIVWHENLDGQGNFGPQQLITLNADHPSSIYAVDVDGDGDNDVLAAALEGDMITWYENTDGLGTFGPQQIISTETDYATSVYASDLDGDGDMDVLSASSADDKVAWYENLDGLGNFGPQIIISASANFNRSVFSEDVDGDGDMDVLSLSSNPNLVTWFENIDGQGTFGPQQIVTSNVIYPTSVFAADMDGDGDIDVLSTSNGDDKIAWYENLGPLSVAENNLDEFIIYPNPTSGILTVKSPTEIVKLEIYNQLGQLVSKESHQNTINISKTRVGLYFLKIYDINGDCYVKKIVKK